MSFFLPKRLIEFEYFGGGEPDKDYAREAEPYQNDIDFAFFAVNFGYSKADYEALTPREKLFIYKANENKIIADSYHIYNAVFTAFYNVNRPKRKRPLKLFRKGAKTADMETVRDNMKIIQEVDKIEGDSWVRRIYESNGMTYRRER